MRKLLLGAISIALIFNLTGCATVYRPVSPFKVNYSAHDMQDDIEIYYKYGVLQESGNVRYAKKANKYRIRVVAVKMINHTDRVINVRNDLKFFAGDKQVFPIEPESTKAMIKQTVPTYLLYLLLTFVNVYVTNNSGTHVYPVGLVVGPLVTIINLAKAGTANQNLLKELKTYNIMDSQINREETVYGMISFRDEGFNPLMVKLAEQ